MSNLIPNLPEIYNSYKNWVSSNPQVVGDVETTVKWVSYLIAGRITSSAAMSELIYTLSNLLVLFNDQIIYKSRNYNKPDTKLTTKNEETLKLFLTTLEYCEVFIEYSAVKVYGDRGRWILIVIVQLIKFIGRLFLTIKYKNKIVNNPPIQTMDRKKIDEKINNTEGFENTGNFSFTLKRSGRVIRKVEGAPPIYVRNWKPIKNEFEDVEANNDINRIAEMLYIAKPLIHLGSAATFGFRSWKSWGTSILVDLFSLRLYYTNRQTLTKDQRVELSRRCVSLLLYLMRSPFYDKYSQDKISALLSSISRNIPLTKAICQPLQSYIPQWQSTYFYMWST